MTALVVASVQDVPICRGCGLMSQLSRGDLCSECVAAALLAYEGKYGPVETVANPRTEPGEGYTNELLSGTEDDR